MYKHGELVIVLVIVNNTQEGNIFGQNGGDLIESELKFMNIE